MSADTDPDVRRRPNVLFIICDQLRADHLGFAGNAVVRTPNIDALAARGTVFDRAYVSNPICMPNRSTIMTGRFPSAHGVVFNDRSLPINATTFVGRLRDEGWATGLIGKSHLQHGESRATVHDRGHPATRSPFDEGWDTVEHHERYEKGEPPAIDDFYGFGHVDLTIGHGATAGGHHYRWARDLGVEHDVLRAGLDPTWPVPGRSTDWWQIHPSPIPDEASSTSFVTERTIDFIRRSTEAATPWMAWCSFPDPHHPMAPPEPWFSRHDPADIELPSTFDDPGEDWPDHLTLFRSLSPDNTGRRPYVMPFGGTADIVRAGIAATYGMIEAIDHGIGRIVESLEELGAADDTIVVFTTDHGDMGGDHGLMLKGVMHFQGCLRTPLVVVEPGRPSQRTDSLAASVDLASTILDLCGVDAFDGMQGHSLRPVLDDATATVRDVVLVEDDFPLAAVVRAWPERTRTVVTGTHRFTRDANGFEMLYDLDGDPDELTNLASRDRPARSSLLEALVDELVLADDISPVGRPTP